MNELLEYCKSRIKCGWVLTKDFLLVEHNCLTGKLLELTSPLIDYMHVLPNTEGVVFKFKNGASRFTSFKLLEYVRYKSQEDAEYILGSDTAKGLYNKNIRLSEELTKLYKFTALIPDSFQIPFAPENNGKVIETTA